MQTSQKILLGIGVVAILGLGIFVYRQMNIPSSVTTSSVKTPVQQKQMQKEMPAVVKEIPSTPEMVTDDILKEIDEDNSMLNEEEQGVTSAVETESATVSDFGTVYDANAN